MSGIRISINCNPNSGLVDSLNGCILEQCKCCNCCRCQKRCTCYDKFEDLFNISCASKFDRESCRYKTEDCSKKLFKTTCKIIKRKLKAKRKNKIITVSKIDGKNKHPSKHWSLAGVDKIKKKSKKLIIKDELKRNRENKISSDTKDEHLPKGGSSADADNGKLEKTGDIIEKSKPQKAEFDSAEAFAPDGSKYESASLALGISANDQPTSAEMTSTKSATSAQPVGSQSALAQSASAQSSSAQMAATKSAQLASASSAAAKAKPAPTTSDQQISSQSASADAKPVTPASAQPAPDGLASDPLAATKGVPVSSSVGREESTPPSDQQKSGQPTSGQPVSGKLASPQSASSQLASAQPVSSTHPEYAKLASAQSTPATLASAQSASAQPPAAQPESGTPSSEKAISKPASSQPTSAPLTSSQPKSDQSAYGSRVSAQPDPVKSASAATAKVLPAQPATDPVIFPKSITAASDSNAAAATAGAQPARAPLGSPSSVKYHSSRGRKHDFISSRLHWLEERRVKYSY